MESTVGPAEATGGQEVIVQAPRMKPLGHLIAMTVLCGTLVPSILGPKPDPGIFFFLVVLAPIFFTTLRWVIWPPRLVVREGKFSVRTVGPELACPASNVASISLAGNTLLLRFSNVDLVDPHAGAALERELDRKGAHVAFGGGFFSRDQIERVRRSLGISACVTDERAAQVEEFHRSLASLTPRVFVTSIILAVNSIVFALMLAFGIHPLTPDIDGLIAWGANYGPRTLAGEWWRLLTSCFIHSGVCHLLFNLWALWNVGRLVERLVGNAGCLILYLLSGICGSILSVWWHPAVVSVGASGAVLGVYGALLGFTVRHKDSIPVEELRNLRSSTFTFLVFNLIFGLTVPGIDVAAHLGGLAAGLACGVLMSRRLSPPRPSGRTAISLSVAAGGTGLLVLAVHLLPPPPGDLRAGISRFGETESQVVAKFNAAIQKVREGQATDVELADLIGAEILPSWRTAREQFESIPNLAVADQPLFARLQEYMRLRQQSWELLTEAARENDQKKAEESREKAAAAEASLRRTRP